MGMEENVIQSHQQLLQLAAYPLFYIFFLQVIIFPGRKLEYECNYCEKPKNEQDFMTAVEFSAENPYGKAVALLNLKSGFLEVFFFFFGERGRRRFSE
jgi:hypothetical protein